MAGAIPTIVPLNAGRGGAAGAGCAAATGAAGSGAVAGAAGGCALGAGARPATGLFVMIIVPLNFAPPPAFI